MKRFNWPSTPIMEQIPRPPQPQLHPNSFVLLPVGALAGVSLEQWLCQQWLYLQAFQQAQAVARPSLPERDLLAVWN
jgi:hypothetical protein